MEVVLCSPRGFCAGVVRAIQVVEECLERFGPPIYVKHQIVHNPYVVGELEAKGAVTVETVEEIPEGSRVVFSAHGSPPEDFERARERNLQVIDAVCPLVTRVHNEAKKYHREGRRIILVGHDGHQEVKGTMGQAPMELVDENSDNGIPVWEDDVPVAVLTQTTLSTGDTAAAIDHIRERFPQAEIRNDICYATTNRQAAVSRMAALVDMALVIGAQNSSNCNRLLELALSLGIPAYLINGPEEIQPEWMAGAARVGIASGASTPEVLVDAVIAALNPEKVTNLEVVDEDISFTMPRELR
ncbi:MAG: 4-hydroxy-3-methylbut-2-enyl diphosphate reductase [Chloroflexota bacterium]|nr:4-hydroxy-3-methylbut-2-enyl diphosphate reductase [Chloroflexota bacterium]